MKETLKKKVDRAISLIQTAGDMATSKEQIEHPWIDKHKSRRWLKKQMNRFIRRKGKKITDDEVGCKTNRKPTKGWEY